MQVLKEAGKAASDAGEVAELVAGIIVDVRERGDAAVVELTKRYDEVDLEALEVPRRRLRSAYDRVERQTVESLEFAAEQLRGFALRQLGCLRALSASHSRGSGWGTG